jgi:CBS-domain-containing membrane protein
MSPERILSKLGVNHVISISCDATVEDALRLLDEKQIRAVPVVDGENVFKGMFSAHEIIKALVPSYMTQGIQTLDFATGASSVLASRLKKMFPSRVGDHVSSEDCVKITTRTQTWEALRMLTRYGSPLPVVDEQSGQLKGLISEQSAMEALLRMEADEAELEENTN